MHGWFLLKPFLDILHSRLLEENREDLWTKIREFEGKVEPSDVAKVEYFVLYSDEDSHGYVELIVKIREIEYRKIATIENRKHWITIGMLFITLLTLYIETREEVHIATDKEGYCIVTLYCNNKKKELRFSPLLMGNHYNAFVQTVNNELREMKKK